MKNSTAFILFLISIGLFYTFILPQWGKVGGLQAQESTYVGVLNNVKNLEAKRDELLAQYKNIPQAQVDELAKILPANVDTVQLALNLNTIASRYGISIKSVSTSAQDPNAVSGINLTDENASSTTPFQTVFVTFTFTSTYDNFRKFMADIEKSLRIIDIRSVTFQANNSTPKAGALYDFHVTVATYWTN